MKDKILTSGWTGVYMARFNPDGKVKWSHSLASVKDNGTFRKIDIQDIVELDDGSIAVRGSLGVRDTASNIFHSWVMKGRAKRMLRSGLQSCGQMVVLS